MGLEPEKQDAGISKWARDYPAIEQLINLASNEKMEYTGWLVEKDSPKTFLSVDHKGCTTRLG